MNGNFLKNILERKNNMSTSREDIREWFKRGKKQKATHLIVVCDTYDHEDYPVFVTKEQDAKTEVNKRDGVNMAKVMEVYNLSMDIETQLKEHRSFNY
jgi:cytochrome oxidase assembly protein ShyY1